MRHMGDGPVAGPGRLFLQQLPVQVPSQGSVIELEDISEAIFSLSAMIVLLRFTSFANVGMLHRSNAAHIEDITQDFMLDIGKKTQQTRW